MRVLLKKTRRAVGGAHVPQTKAKIRKLCKFDAPWLRNRTLYRKVELTAEAPWPLDYNVK